MTAVDVLRIATELTFLGCFVIALRALLRSRSSQAWWLFWVFASLSFVIVVGMIRGPDADPLPAPWTQLLVLILVAFPYSLVRFAAALTGGARRLVRIANVASLFLAVFVLVPGNLAEDQNAALTGLQIAFLATFLSVWGGQTLAAGVLLLRGRRGQARIVQRRLRLLAIATFMIGLALFVSAGGGGDDAESDTEGWSEVATQGFAALSGVLFLVGFAPPRTLRAAWRHDDERTLYDVAVDFLSAVSVDEVIDRLLPGLRAVLGAPAVALIDEDGQPIAVDGTDETDWIDTARRLQLHDRVLAVRKSTRMPVIGEDEVELVERLGLLTALASDRARLIVAEQQARARVEEGNRRLAALNAELEAFLYSTSHDLKNPVIALVGYVDLLRTEFDDELPDDAKHYLARLEANSRQIEALINDLLELSRVGRVEAPAKAVDLEQVIDGLRDDLGQQWPSAILTRTDLPTVMMSPQRATQLFGNLVHNACRYSGRDDVEIHVSATSDPTLGTVTVMVSDNGVGIPTDQAERVFGMFERLDPSAAGGTGMGLAICRRIVEHLGGTVALRPSDAGATFAIEFPDAVTVGTHQFDPGAAEGSDDDPTGATPPAVVETS